MLPPLPLAVPGLEFGHHYRAALDESNVGGDFYAVYPLDELRYALVIGDVSGKGLAAASQVSSLQNMLRYALCASESLSAAMTQMNAIVSSQSTLSGFATMFVGIYHAADRSLTYASCGHEPPFILSGIEVRTLETTGPPIGATSDARYREVRVTLKDGDVLMMYTDGLSEAGPDTRRLLGHEALMGLLQRRYSAAEDISAMTNAIMADVLRHAEGRLRDDACLILARRNDSATG